MTKTWQVNSSTGKVTYTQTSCPDIDCQRIVDGQLRAEQAKRTAQKLESTLRESARKEHLAVSRAAK